MKATITIAVSEDNGIQCQLQSLETGATVARTVEYSDIGGDARQVSMIRELLALARADTVADVGLNEIQTP